MTGKGILIECIKDMDIEIKDTNENLVFLKDVFYTALISDKIYVIDRNHKNIKLDQNIFKKHFKIINNNG